MPEQKTEERDEGKPVYRFTADNTVREMLVAAEALEKAGHNPRFRFVRSYNEAIEAIDVHVDSPEMAVVE